MDIQANSSLTSLGGLDGLTSIGGRVEIRDNSSLTSLGGLDALVSIGSTLHIEHNASLTSLARLRALTSVDASVYVGNNAVLESLAGLESDKPGGAQRHDVDRWGARGELQHGTHQPRRAQRPGFGGC